MATFVGLAVLLSGFVAFGVAVVLTVRDVRRGGQRRRAVQRGDERRNRRRLTQYTVMDIDRGVMPG